MDFYTGISKLRKIILRTLWLPFEILDVLDSFIINL